MTLEGGPLMADAEERSDEVLFRAAARADALRAVGLRGLEEAARARQIGLEREHGRLSAALGTDHPRTRAVGEQIRHGAERLRHVGLEVARAETAAPRTERGEWMLHGYVRDRDLNPVPDLTLSLVDAPGRVVKWLGSGCTDAKGYFRIVAKVARAETGADRTVEEHPAPESVHIRLTDASGKQVYRGEEAIRPAPDQVEYREIVLGPGASGCAPPPSEPTEPDQPTPKKSRRRGKPRGGER
jgi:hypothetical protein